MSTQPRKKLTSVHQKLYEKKSAAGILAVYQTEHLGLTLKLNESVLLTEQDGFFYQEMMTHPALFTQPKPRSIAILGNYYGILNEVLKHQQVQEIVCIHDNTHLDHAVAQYFPALYAIRQLPRVSCHLMEPFSFLEQYKNHFDIIIQGHYSANFLQENYQRYHEALSTKGILVQPCPSALLQPQSLKPIIQNIERAQFFDWQLLNFPQPSASDSLRTVLLANKAASFNRIREKDIYNRGFATRYYNYDTHKAALALPEFIREEIE